VGVLQKRWQADTRYSRDPATHDPEPARNAGPAKHHKPASAHGTAPANCYGHRPPEACAHGPQGRVPRSNSYPIAAVNSVFADIQRHRAGQPGGTTEIALLSRRAPGYSRPAPRSLNRRPGGASQNREAVVVALLAPFAVGRRSRAAPASQLVRACHRGLWSVTSTMSPTCTAWRPTTRCVPRCRSSSCLPARRIGPRANPGPRAVASAGVRTGGPVFPRLWACAARDDLLAALLPRAGRFLRVQLSEMFAPELDWPKRAHARGCRRGDLV
jgi:hypothetical protein